MLFRYNLTAICREIPLDERDKVGDLSTVRLEVASSVRNVFVLLHCDLANILVLI